MKRIAILICALIMTSFVYGATTNFMVNLATAKHKAALEGKLYMVHFTANWCTPCKWMKEHTFTDDRVAQYLTDYYVPVKINVEDFDGIIIKQKNNVQFLPTVLIFNSKGEEVGRFEEAIGPSKLMAILEESNIPVNTEKVNMPEPLEAENPEAISRPLLPSIFDDSDKLKNIEEASIPEKDEDIISTPTELNKAPVYTPPSIEVPQRTIPAPESTFPEEINSEVLVAENPTNVINSVPYVASNTTAAESLAFLTGEGIFELDVKFKNKQGYSIQIGLYAKYENVLAEVHKFKNKYQQNVYVHIDKRSGVPVYRLLMGSFDIKTDADQMEYSLKNQGLDCFVRDLSKI